MKSEKEEFLNKIENELKEISLKEAKAVIYDLALKLDRSKYQLTLSIIDHIKGNKVNKEEILNKIEDIKREYKQVEEGEICIICYNYGDYYGANFCFYPSDELNDLINTTYELGKNLVYMKEYELAVEVLNLILETDYLCEEIDNPEYSSSDEVLDVFDSDIYKIKDSLDFNFDYIYLYSIYAVLMGKYNDKCERIYNYLKEDFHIDINNALELGIEKINNIDKFYEEFKEYLTAKNEDESKKILEIMEKK